MFAESKSGIDLHPYTQVCNILTPLPQNQNGSHTNLSSAQQFLGTLEPFVLGSESTCGEIDNCQIFCSTSSTLVADVSVIAK